MFSKTNANSVMSIASSASTNATVAGTTYSFGHTDDAQDVTAMISATTGYENSYLFGAVAVDDGNGNTLLTSVIQPAASSYNIDEDDELCYQQIKAIRQHNFYGAETNIVSGTFNVNEATTLASTLDVGSATTLNSILHVYGATTLESTLDVLGATTLDSTLDVGGATILNSTLGVYGTITLGDPNAAQNPTGGTISTSANTITIDPATVGDDTGTLIIKGGLTVEGTTTTINSTQVDIGDRIINLSTGNGTVNCGISHNDGTTNIFIYNPTTDTWSTENNNLTTGNGNLTVNGNVVHTDASNNTVTTTITEISSRLSTLEKFFRIHNDGSLQIGYDANAQVYFPGTQHFGALVPNTVALHNTNYAGNSTTKGLSYV